MANIAEGYSCLEINKNGKCFLHTKGFDTTYTAMLDSTILKKLWHFASNIDIKSKKDRYLCDVIDGGEAGTFAAYFDDGTVKRIDF